MSHSFSKKLKEIVKEKIYDIKWFFSDYKKEIVIFLTIFVVSTISFALGYLFCYYYVKVSPIIIQKSSFQNNKHRPNLNLEQCFLKGNRRLSEKINFSDKSH